jgi:hypothetical protein
MKKCMHVVETNLKIQLSLSCKYLFKPKILGEKAVFWILTNLNCIFMDSESNQMSTTP